MQENKVKFELAAKVVGLVLVAFGIVMALDAVTLLLNIPDYKKMYEALQIPNEYQQLLKHLDRFERNLWSKLFIALVVQSICPILSGLYLMKPDNFFSQYTYPATVKAEDKPQIDDHYAEPDDHRPFVIGNIPVDAAGSIRR